MEPSQHPSSVPGEGQFSRDEGWPRWSFGAQQLPTLDSEGLFGGKGPTSTLQVVGIIARALSALEFGHPQLPPSRSDNLLVDWPKPVGPASPDLCSET